MVWTRGMGTGHMQEATPLVYDGVMYVPEPGRPHPGDRREDRRPASGSTSASYPEGVQRRHQPQHRDLGHARSSTRSADNSIYALDAQTGKLVWETQVLDADEARADASSGPIIANGKVITGRQCQPDAANDACIITAHDAKTGKELWRTRTIPRPGRAGLRDVGRRADGAALARRHVDGAELRPRAEPDLRRHVGDDPGAEVHARRQRQEAPLSQLARSRSNADTGKIVWYYQHVVDHWDLDHPFERLLVETAVAPDAKEVRVDQSEASSRASGAR